MAKQTENQKLNIVLGIVTDSNGSPLANLKVVLYDVDMREWQQLAETYTNKEGKYELTWLQEQLSGRGKESADIAIKVFTKEKNTLLFASIIDEVRFNASEREEINITINQALPKEIVEFDFLVKEVSFLANKIAIADLQENDEHRDITFLSKELELPAIKIEHLVVAHRLQIHSKIDAAFFYALLREDTLLHSNITKTFTARLSINLTADIETLLYDAVLTDPKKIIADVKTAVKDMVVAAKVGRECNRNIELLQRYRKQADTYNKTDHKQKLYDTISGFVLSGKLEVAGKLFSENKADLNAFFNKLSDPSFANSGTVNPKINSDLEKIFGLGKLQQAGNNSSKKAAKESAPKQLAKLNKDAWVGKLTKEFSSINLTADIKNAISLTASNMVRTFEKEFPTTVFAAQLARQKKEVLNNQKSIVSFLNKHEDFDLTSHHIDSFLKEKKVSKKDSEAIAPELNAVQRIFQLVPHFSKTNVLRSEGFTSSASIVAAGETRFVHEIAPKAGIDAVEAKQIFSKASNINTAAMLIAGEMHHTISAMPIAALETTLLEDKLKAVSKDFPNLKSLFKSGDTCACEHCRSVYSPAAYMVEALQFLENRAVIDIETRTTSVFSAKDVLFQRRADLGDIDLSCENANTPVKYIDMVCEVLEEAIATDKGIPYTGALAAGTNPLKGKISTTLYNALHGLDWPVTKEAIIYPTETVAPTLFPHYHYLRDKKIVCKIEEKSAGIFTIYRLRQTLSTAEELAAAPEYINENAYSLLRNNSFAFTLPFDLNHVEGKAYFDRFGISRAKLMEDFRVHSIPSYKEIAAEKLSLTDAERKIVVRPRASIAGQQSVWHAPVFPLGWSAPIGELPAMVTGSVLDFMKRVDIFLNKTGLNFKQLDLLLSLRFIDPTEALVPPATVDFTKALFIKNKDLSCNTDKKEIANLDIDDLDKIHRFLRLQKKTGWSFEVLDEIIWQTNLGNTKLNNDCLIKAATLVNIAEATGIKIEELIGCFGEMPHRIIKDDIPAPLYYKVYVNKAKNGFVEKMLLPENVNGTQLLTIHATSIAVCLQMKEADLVKLFPILLSNKIDFTNLSHLFAASRLIKKLKLSVDDFIILKELTGITIFDSPQNMLAFIHAVEKFKKSPLKAADVKFMLRHPAPDTLNIEPKAIQVLGKLQKDYAVNDELYKSKYDSKQKVEEQIVLLETELSKLSGIDEKDVKTVLSYVQRNWLLASEINQIIDDKIASHISDTDLDNLKLKIDDIETATDISYLSKRENGINVFLQLVNPSLILTGLSFDKKKFELKKKLIELPYMSIEEIEAFFIFVMRVPISIAQQFIVNKFTWDTILLNPALENVWLASESDKESMQNVLLDIVFNEISTFNIKQGKQTILEQNIITGFKVDEALVKIILKFAQTKKSGLGIKSVLEIFNLPVNSTNFPQQFEALKLLNKLFPLINSFKLKTEEVAWYFENNKTLGWFEWDSIPYETTHVPLDYKKFIDFAEMVHLSKQFTPVANPADAANPFSFLSIQQMLLLPSTTHCLY
jgi:5-hydroxyisourate hydrolase-like protein (transthyretin family)